MRNLDYRDAAILWLIANSMALITAALIVAYNFAPQPLAAVSLIASVSTGAVAVAAIVAAVASLIIGLKGDAHA